MPKPEKLKPKMDPELEAELKALGLEDDEEFLQFLSQTDGADLLSGPMGPSGPRPVRPGPSGPIPKYAQPQRPIAPGTVPIRSQNHSIKERNPMNVPAVSKHSTGQMVPTSISHPQPTQVAFNFEYFLQRTIL